MNEADFPPSLSVFLINSLLACQIPSSAFLRKFQNACSFDKNRHLYYALAD
ncbi:hypothetical protein BSI_38790 [Bacillus inaquosorum KCTC 13429]|uniref:Uncharacterized protein n=1 Tax=Bacillus inaquosorum KCTC 13429 TaxID=1236548 RepID=A0A9W5LEZ5_9BACI|nr:hypothetical protein BSI_38790 [Bacillus inaquosorum KCTC 13429]